MMYDHKTSNAALAAQAFHATGVASQERGRQKALAVLQWVYRWRWTTPELIPQIVGAQSRAFAGSLVKKGLLCEVKTYAGTADGNPAKLLFLTKAGERYLQNYEFESWRGYVFGNRYNAKTMQHDLRVQREVLNWLQEQHSDDEQRSYLSPYELRDGLPKGALGPKRPDAVLVRSNRAGDDYLTALEVELTPKNRELRARMATQTLQMLACGVVHDVVVLTPTDNVRDAYRASYAVGAPWSYDDDLTGTTQHRQVTPQQASAVHVQTLGQRQPTPVLDQAWLAHAQELRQHDEPARDIRQLLL